MLSNAGSFDLANIEAQACGKPALGFSVGGVVETIIRNKTGFLAKDNIEAHEHIKSRKFLDLQEVQISQKTKKFPVSIEQINY